MSHLQILSFALGQAVSEAISPQWEEFYQWTARKVTGNSHSLDPAEERRTIPISNSIIHDSPYAVYSLVHGLLTGVTGPRTLLIDLGDSTQITRGTLLFHFSVALRTWYESHGPNSSTVKTILLIPDLPPPNDEVRRNFDPLLSSANLFIVSASGETLPPIAGVEPGRFVLSQISARGAPSELLKKKLIRRHGHFRRGDDGSKYCLSVFYDGRFCESETAIVLTEFANRNQFALGTCPVVLYHGQLSPWFENAAVAVAQKLDLRCFDLSERNIFKRLKKVKPQAAFLFVDMIDRGQTVQRILAAILDVNPNIEIHAISVLTTGIDDPQQNTREFTISGRKISFTCIHRVDVQRFPDKECEMCNLKIPVNNELDDPDLTEPLKIPSYHMWSMVERVGTEPEPEVPIHRQAFESVPKFPILIKEHGAWLVDKFRQCVEERWGGIHDPVVLCPEENAAEALAEHIKLILGWSIIQIPRPLIDAISANENVANIADEKSQRALFELKNINHSDIVILDIFNISGKTLMNIYKLAATVAWRNPVGCLLFMDLNPAVTTSLPCEVLSLYSLQANIQLK